MIQNFEIVAYFFLLAMAYVTFYSYKRKQLSKYGLIFWVAVWVVAALAIIFNESLSGFLADLNILRVFDLYTIAGFMFFLFMIFYLFRVVKENERRMEELVRVLAIKDMKRGK